MNGEVLAIGAPPQYIINLFHYLYCRIYTTTHYMNHVQMFTSKIAILVLLGCMILLCSGVSAEETNWTDAIVEGKFSFMLPPDWTYSQVDTASGKADTLINANNPNGTYVLLLTDTEVAEGTEEDVAKIGLGGFMTSQSITALKDYDVTYSEDDNVASVIGADPQGSIYSVVFYPIEKKSLLIMGNYNNEDQAKDEISTLVEIVKTASLI